jgi:hypothetical protein
VLYRYNAIVRSPNVTVRSMASYFFHVQRTRPPCHICKAIPCLWEQEDLNVTLTAISQLWNAADFLARLPRHDSSTAGAAAGQQHGTVDSSQYAALLEVLFDALQASCCAAGVT